VHQWMDFFDWMWVGAMMIVWILVIAAIGYAAVLVAWRRTNRPSPWQRTRRAPSATRALTLD
jgi:cytochrome c oxidase assembly factor CtaG